MEDSQMRCVVNNVSPCTFDLAVLLPTVFCEQDECLSQDSSIV